jgi:hypothetical protein
MTGNANENERVGLQSSLATRNNRVSKGGLHDPPRLLLIRAIIVLSGHGLDLLLRYRLSGRQPLSEILGQHLRRLRGRNVPRKRQRSTTSTRAA